MPQSGSGSSGTGGMGASGSGGQPAEPECDPDECDDPLLGEACCTERGRCGVRLLISCSD
jgi:hypothetical protein